VAPNLKLALLAIVAVTAAAPAARAQGMRRFAIVAGNDVGGGDTRSLLYASADARKVHEILTRLGGVRPEDATLLIGASASQLLGAIVAVEMQAAEAAKRGERTALLFYYSGHAKDGALRLGETRVPIDGIKARIASSPIDVRVAILDSCKSGAITRTKGARRAPAFEIQADSARDAKGVVILTSSTSDEDSQESDAIGGSYFSHHLASGLLGGADKSGDGRVTLFEAYAYAYDRTVADTAESAAGAQHPTFSYDLAGNGDLVLTDVAVRHEGVYIPREAPSGVYFLVDGKGFVAAEISKADGVDRRVALSPGRYRVKRRLPDKLRVGEIDVPRGQMVALAEARLRDAPFSDDPVKGAGRIELSSRWSLSAGATYQSVFAAPSGASLFPPTGLLAADLSLRNFLRKDWIWSLDIAAGSTDGVVASVGAPFKFSEVSLGSSLLVEWPGRVVSPFVGGRLAMLMMGRRFDQDVYPAQFFSTLSPGLVGGAAFRVMDHTSLVARGRLHYLLYNIDEDRSLGYWELAALVSYDL
jgi:uncharacterized caspase-like protein